MNPWLYWGPAILVCGLSVLAFGLYTMYVRVVLDEEIDLLSDYEWIIWAWGFVWLWAPVLGLAWPLTLVVGLALGVAYPLMVKARDARERKVEQERQEQIEETLAQRREDARRVAMRKSGH